MNTSAIQKWIIDWSKDRTILDTYISQENKGYEELARALEVARQVKSNTGFENLQRLILQKLSSKGYEQNIKEIVRDVYDCAEDRPGKFLEKAFKWYFKALNNLEQYSGERKRNILKQLTEVANDFTNAGKLMKASVKQFVPQGT